MRNLNLIVCEGIIKNIVRSLNYVLTCETRVWAGLNQLHDWLLAKSWDYGTTIPGLSALFSSNTKIYN